MALWFMALRLFFASILLLSLSVCTAAESRLESEFKLAVPSGQREAVWAYLNEAYGEGGAMRTLLGPEYTVSFATDEFVDRYFDTPDLKLLELHSGLRHRSRYIIEGKDRRKDGRQLVQLKLSTPDDSGVIREEVKFKVRDNPAKVRDPDDSLACVGLVKRSERADLLYRLDEVPVDHQQLREVLVLLQNRRRCYISRLGEPFATITLDNVVGRSGFIYIVEFDEMELELNEIAYTDGDQDTRAQMTAINAKMKDDLFTRFPDLKQDQTPKYNKAFNKLIKRDPFFTQAVEWGFRPELLLALLLPLFGVLGWKALRHLRK